MIAVIDLGTNTSNLVVADLTDQKITILYQGKEYVRLGDRQIAENVISNAALARASAAVTRQTRIARKWGADKIRIIATSAVRQAVNRYELIDAIYESEGIEVEVIDGEREADLIYQGVNLAIGPLPDASVILDIGGGSNEVIISENGSILWRFSFAAGMSRIISQFPISDPVTSSEIKSLQEYFEDVHQEAIKKCRQYRVKTLIGCSGAFNTLADVLEGTDPEEMFRIRKEISLKDFEKVYQQIISSSTTERIIMKGMDMVRTELIVPAMILTRTMIKNAGIKEIMQTGYSLREGVLQEMIKH
jgi:exopolyphosphatase/guanosine-5'-triphosphate,3'-diphosphate pyrophosphatase